jgi:3-hydroxyisobutyrate dehydrogenase-like beta-hydroxyacid dehydrogenase
VTKGIAFIGFGEAGGAIVEGWGGSAAIRAYDIKTDNNATAAPMRARYDRLGVVGCDSAAEAVAEADLVFSTVTADQAVKAAENCAPHMRKGSFWFDLNSCAPSSKQRAAELMAAVGARYVDVAVMAPVYPKRNMVPLLIAGPHAEDAKPLLEALPMAPRVVDGDVGAASSIKMIRSIMVKGLEALTAECVLAAVTAGVDGEVLASLLRSHPGVDWPVQAAYNFERGIVHGERRAAEMREVVKTVEDLKLPVEMSAATVAWQSRIGALKLTVPEDPDGTKYNDFAQQLLPHLKKN